MLFDLRGRGRRRTVQTIYLGLAILMGGGLVLFGVGSSTNGGLLDAITGGSSSSSNSAFSQILKNDQRRVAANPNDASAWADLARVHYQIAGQGANYNQATSTFTAAGKAELAQVGSSWDRYLALNPPSPDNSLARLMMVAFGPNGLNQPSRAVSAAEVVSQAQPIAINYAYLAQFAYQAGQIRKGDLAATKAVSLAPASERKQFQQQLAQIKATATGKTATGAPSTTTTTPSRTTTTPGG
jgi:hypothetical protein